MGNYLHVSKPLPPPPTPPQVKRSSIYMYNYDHEVLATKVSLWELFFTTCMRTEKFFGQCLCVYLHVSTR